MAVTIRKWATFMEELHRGGRQAARAAAAPGRRRGRREEPYAGVDGDDLSELIDFGEILGDGADGPRQGGPRHARSRRMARAASSASTASWSTSRRASTRSSARRPAAASAASRSCRRSRSAARWARRLDIPVHHIKAMLVRSHFDAMEISVPDAPGADELLLALAVTDGGRPHARVGGLKAEDAVGEDGLH